MTTLDIVFKKIESEDKSKYITSYSNSNAEKMKVTLFDIKSINTKVILIIEKSVGKGSGLIIDSAINHNISFSKYNFVDGSSYFELPNKDLINIQNIDDYKCFKWCLVRYLHPVDLNP